MKKIIILAFILASCTKKEITPDCGCNRIIELGKGGSYYHGQLMFYHAKITTKDDCNENVIKVFEWKGQSPYNKNKGECY